MKPAISTGDSSKIGRHALSAVMSSSFGIATSILLDAIIMWLFGLGWQTDAYFIAITIPMVALTIINLQATRVIQPLYISKRLKEGENGAWGFVNLTMTNGLTLVVASSLAAILLSPFLIRFQAVGSEQSLITLSTQLSVLFFLILPLYLPIEIMGVVLNSFGNFGLPAATRFIENTFKIIFVLLLGRRFGVMALVFGTFCGVICQTCFCYLALRRRGYSFKPIFRFRDRELVAAYRLMVYPLAGQFCTIVVELVNNALSSLVGAGGVSALRLATRIIESFSGLLGGSIVVATLPAITDNLSKRDIDGAKKTLRRGVYLLLLITVPLSIWLALMNKPLIALIYERKSFSSADTTLVATVLLVMIPYIFLSRLLGLFELPFFAAQDTRTPLVCAVLKAIFYVLLSLLSFRALGIYALPFSRSLSFLIGCLLLLFFLRRRMSALGFGTLRQSVSKIVWASLIMGLSILLGGWALQLTPVTGFASKLIALCVPSVAGLVALLVTLVLARVFDPAEVKEGMYFLRSAFSRVIGIKRYSSG